jgi:hypothetical protein
MSEGETVRIEGAGSKPLSAVPLTAEEARAILGKLAAVQSWISMVRRHLDVGVEYVFPSTEPTLCTIQDRIAYFSDGGSKLLIGCQVEFQHKLPSEPYAYLSPSWRITRRDSATFLLICHGTVRSVFDAAVRHLATEVVSSDANPHSDLPHGRPALASAYIHGTDVLSTRIDSALAAMGQRAGHIGEDAIAEDEVCDCPLGKDCPVEPVEIATAGVFDVAACPVCGRTEAHTCTITPPADEDEARKRAEAEFFRKTNH